MPKIYSDKIRGQRFKTRQSSEAAEEESSGLLHIPVHIAQSCQALLRGETQALQLRHLILPPRRQAAAAGRRRRGRS